MLVRYLQEDLPHLCQRHSQSLVQHYSNLLQIVDIGYRQCDSQVYRLRYMHPHQTDPLDLVLVQHDHLWHRMGYQYVDSQNQMHSQSYLSFQKNIDEYLHLKHLYESWSKRFVAQSQFLQSVHRLQLWW